MSRVKPLAAPQDPSDQRLPQNLPARARPCASIYRIRWRRFLGNLGNVNSCSGRSVLSGSRGLRLERHSSVNRRTCWCGRGDLNPHCPAASGFSYQPQLSLPPFRRSLWSGLSLHHCVIALGAARLVSTPSRHQMPGLARDRQLQGFPEFERFCASSFP